MPPLTVFPSLNLPPDAQDEILSFVERRRDRLIGIPRDLIRTDSQNTPPSGAELACQQWIAGRLQACGLQPDVYLLEDVAGLREHAFYHPGREYAKRPNVAAPCRLGRRQVATALRTTSIQFPKEPKTRRAIPSERKWRGTGFMDAARTI